MPTPPVYSIFHSRKLAMAGENECWLWTGHVRADGYAGTSRAGRTEYVHRFAYEDWHGVQIPDDKVIDHQCRVRNCCNPGHLEVVSQAVNVQRGQLADVNRNRAAQTPKKTHCKRGHEFAPANTYTWNGHRGCRECIRAGSRERDRLARERRSTDAAVANS